MVAYVLGARLDLLSLVDGPSILIENLLSSLGELDGDGYLWVRCGKMVRVEEVVRSMGRCDFYVRGSKGELLV